MPRRSYTSTSVALGVATALASLAATAQETSSGLEEVVVTNSIPPRTPQSLKKVKYLSIGKLLGEAIRRIHSNDSVSSLFV